MTFIIATSLNTSEMLGSDDDDDVHLHNTSNLDDNGDDLVKIYTYS